MADAPIDPEAPASPLLELRAVMARLRSECAWKAAQTHRSLARHLLEETHETLEAIEAIEAIEDDDADALREELGDLLLQVYFHAAVAEEAGGFTIEDVADGLVGKLLRRNPHVFGGPGERPTDPAAVNELWESVKAAEKERDSALDGIPPTLPALLLADKVLDRLTRAGSTPDALLARAGRDRQVDPAEAEVAADLLAVVARARDAGVDPEQALRVLARSLADGA